MRFLLLNDVHMAFKGPVTRLDDWPETILGKLDQVGLLARKLGVAAVCIAGDMFHLRSRSTFAILYRLMDWAFALQRDGIKVLAIPGNHDEVHERLDSVPTQPLGLLFKSGAVLDVSYQPVYFPADTYKSVAVIGIPYPDAADMANWERLVHHADRAIVMAHCFASPEGGQFFNDTFLRYGDLSRFPYDVFHFGHDHSDHGVARVDGTRGPQYFVNLGAIGRGSIAQDQINRDVKIAFVEFGDTVKVQQVKLKVQPAADVFDLSLKAAKDRERAAVERFVGQLSADLAGTGRVDFRERIGKLDVPDAVRERLEAYIEAAEQSQTGQ